MQFILLGMTLSIRQAFQRMWCNLLGQGKRNIPPFSFQDLLERLLLLVIRLYNNLLELYLGFLTWESLNFSSVHSFVRQTARVAKQSRGYVVSLFSFVNKVECSSHTLGLVKH